MGTMTKLILLIVAASLCGHASAELCHYATRMSHIPKSHAKRSQRPPGTGFLTNAQAGLCDRKATLVITRAAPDKRRVIGYKLCQKCADRELEILTAKATFIPFPMPRYGDKVQVNFGGEGKMFPATYEGKDPRGRKVFNNEKS